MSSSLSYRKDIDGLRAVAVLSVLFYHAGIGAPGGFVGVDVFFVISGYLITGLILKDLAAGEFSLAQFWERRIRRIFPAMIFVVAASTVAGAFLLFPRDFADMGASLCAQALLSSNFHFCTKAGYFERAADFQPLLHTWSLAVEEQFYLLFPLLLLWVRRGKPGAMALVLSVLSALSFLLSVWWTSSAPDSNFYLLPSRAWELLMGSLLAVIPARRGTRWVAELAAVTGLAAVAYAIFYYSDETRFPGVTALLPCGGAALVIWAGGTSATCVGWLLALRPMVFVGLISYSLYLWHWPVLVFYKYWNFEVSQEEQPLIPVVCLALASLSWWLVERPFRQKKTCGDRRSLFLCAGVGTLSLLVAGMCIVFAQGIPARIPAQALAYFNTTVDKTFRIEVTLQRAQRGEWIELGAGDVSKQPDIFVWGDSHGMALLPAVDALCKERGLRGQAATRSSTVPLIGYEAKQTFKDHKAYNRAVLDYIIAQKISRVLVVANWDRYHDNKLRAPIIATAKELEKVGARLWIFREVPKHPWHVPHAVASAVWHGQDPLALEMPESFHLEGKRDRDSIYAGLSELHPNITVLDSTQLFLSPDGKRMKFLENGELLYWDDNHLTVAGALLLKPLLEQIFDPAPVHPDR